MMKVGAEMTSGERMVWAAEFARSRGSAGIAARKAAAAVRDMRESLAAAGGDRRSVVRRGSRDEDRAIPVDMIGRGGHVIVLDVLGTPAPKGSARAMLIGGKARLIGGSSNKNTTAQRQWARAVRDVALAQPDRYKNMPLYVVIEFRVARPAAAKKRPAPMVKPDLDKLVRCTLDALVTTTQSGRVLEGIIDDDARIVRIEVEKVYAEPGNEGAHIVIGGYAGDLREARARAALGHDAAAPKPAGTYGARTSA